jgi:hypothetical protein
MPKSGCASAKILPDNQLSHCTAGFRSDLGRLEVKTGKAQHEHKISDFSLCPNPPRLIASPPKPLADYGRRMAFQRLQPAAHA